jgi:hypothetical protein
VVVPVVVATGQPMVLLSMVAVLAQFQTRTPATQAPQTLAVVVVVVKEFSVALPQALEAPV